VHRADADAEVAVAGGSLGVMPVERDLRGFVDLVQRQRRVVLDVGVVTEPSGEVLGILLDIEAASSFA